MVELQQLHRPRQDSRRRRNRLGRKIVQKERLMVNQVIQQREPITEPLLVVFCSLHHLLLNKVLKLLNRLWALLRVISNSRLSSLGRLVQLLLPHHQGLSRPSLCNQEVARLLSLRPKQPNSLSKLFQVLHLNKGLNRHNPVPVPPRRLSRK